MTKTKWFSENIDQITPQPLSGALRGLFKLRVVDYRIIYSINSKHLLVTVHMAIVARFIANGDLLLIHFANKTISRTIDR